MNFIKHFFKRHLCVDSIYIDNNGDDLTPALRCGKCNKKIGFIYSCQDGWKTFLYSNFKRYKQRIERWVDEHTKNQNQIGNSYEREWRDVLYNIKQWREDSLLTLECEECEKDSERCEFDGTGEIYRTEIGQETV